MVQIYFQFLHPAHCEVYSIQHYVIKFVSDLRQVGGFLRVHRFPPPIKQINIRENEGAINNRQSRETGNIGYTRHKTKTNETSAKIYISGLLQANICYHLTVYRSQNNLDCRLNVKYL
jgi:hypothetical protein